MNKVGNSVRKLRKSGDVWTEDKGCGDGNSCNNYVSRWRQASQSGESLQLTHTFAAVELWNAVRFVFPSTAYEY
jgi:hypothetical protein